MKDILEEAGIEITPQNKKQIDQAIHNIVEVEYKACPTTWKKLKQEIISDEQKRNSFITNLQDALK